MKTKIKIGEKFYIVDASRIGEKLIKVTIDNEEFIFTENEFQELALLDKKNYPSEISEGDEIICGIFKEKEIKSPIPGTISAIFVKEGDEVKPNQKVLTLISMKMENEIISETCGKVKKIKAKENKFVNTGDVLIILE